jgi:hypothetical protein
MKTRLKILLAIVSVAVFLSPATGAAASNSDVLFNGVCSSGGDSSAVCQDDRVSGNSSKSNPLLGSNGLLLKISAIMAVIGGVAATIVAIVSGLRFITSGGDPAKAQSARATLLNAIIGVVVIVLAESIIAFVLSRV